MTSSRRKAASLLAGAALSFAAPRAQAQTAPEEAPPVPALPPPPPAPEAAPPPPPPAPAEVPSAYPRLRPFASIVGGVKVDNPIQPAQNHASNRFSAIMLSDFGLRGELTSWASFESELMANGGVDLHGSSVFEGQAALQIRKQLIRLAKDWWTVEVGRVIDEASVDYFSYHVADVFLQDGATRGPLLFDGFNLGNGVRGTAEVLPGLRIGLAGNAGNPTSSSSVLAFGGSFPPYSAIFYQSAQKTREDLNGYPDDQFQSYVITPSLLYAHRYVEARAAFQYFVINPNATNGGSSVLYGYNARGTVAAHFWNNLVSPFASFNYDRNDTVKPTNVTQLSADKYTGIGFGGGVDLNLRERQGNYDGIGAQFMQDQSQVGGGIVATTRYYNVGATYWLTHNIATGLRYAQWEFTAPGQDTTGERSVLGTMRLVL